MFANKTGRNVLNYVFSSLFFELRLYFANNVIPAINPENRQENCRNTHPCDKFLSRLDEYPIRIKILVKLRPLLELSTKFLVFFFQCPQSLGARVCFINVATCWKPGSILKCSLPNRHRPLAGLDPFRPQHAESHVVNPSAVD